jgi:hypothetical protein
VRILQLKQGTIEGLGKGIVRLASFRGSTARWFECSCGKDSIDPVSGNLCDPDPGLSKSAYPYARGLAVKDEYPHIGGICDIDDLVADGQLVRETWNKGKGD